MIILKLKDGLGNQLFLYSFARMLQSKYNEKIMIDLSGFNKCKRKFALNNFKLNDNVFIPSESVRIFHKYMFLLKKKIFKKNINFDSKNSLLSYKHMVKNGMYYSQDTFKYYPFIKTYKKNKYIWGYYQAAGYSMDIRDILIDDLKVITPASPENENMIMEIKGCNSVCVHIRRGDYVSSEWSNRLEICTEAYYNKAMELLVNKVESPIFYIFSNCSDDINWIKQNYHFKFPVKYVDLQNPDYEEFRLMYNCKHFIISNSSFSWWSSFLSDNEDKIVVAPSKWYKLKDTPADDIYIDSWILVEV